MKTFRFDDICINSDGHNELQIATYLKQKFPGCRIIFGISPLVHDKKDCDQRVYPKIFNAFSSNVPFFEPTQCGVPRIPDFIEPAGHGLWHIDHRLIPDSLSTASILTSCSLTNSKIFIPPFNKYDNSMIETCEEHEIELIKFEHGWKSMEHNEFNDDHNLWYLHARCWNIETFKTYMNHE